MINALITGATGMTGSLILDHCLESRAIGMVSVVGRRPTGRQHPKLREYIHEDFEDFSKAKKVFEQVDVVYYCLGVYTGQVSKEDFQKITLNYTRAFADAIKEHSPAAVFCFLSGSGADRKEKSKMAFARFKGMAENHLRKLELDRYCFRPAYIYPVHKRKEPNLMYTISRMLYPLIRLFGPTASIKSTQLAHAMFLVGIRGHHLEILKNKDIIRVVKRR